ncbi:P-loop NTPase fold protein [Acinetobacter rudis]|uniref:P-loop NTPase fold protein n=1 Tax=Acinetobacter rudis TaxID=632955 RepID=A0AAW8JD91_9GAMM|nr:P-loop NTPase fold protein [Acinetobacter rudis]MDQ8936651.1 P-loop NTPase fold protein [Acinetobacter rudis]MDQ9018863.1 P-loop NTPase fold protein [Acinetobacter rudis]
MPEYISEPNKHIEEYLDYYCNDRLNDYAVLIRGDWGAGKTWFIKEYEKKLKQDGFNRVVYISLNGVSGKDAIDDMIFCALHPVLSHKITKVIGRVAAGAVKASTKIDINSSETTLSLSTPTIDVSSVFKEGKKLILIFDDLERCQMKVSESLGYINYFVEHTESRAIILANEEKLSKCDTYKKEKEKLVGATFEFKGDIRSALNYFISELKSRSIKPKLSKEDNFESIITIYNTSKFNNIRSLRQSLREFERFYNKQILKENEELFSKILILFLIFSLELRNNGFDGEILKFRVDKENSTFQEKYNLGQFGSFLLSDATWNNILSKNIIDNTVIDDELEKNYFQYLSDQPDWLKLWKYFDLTNEEFNIVVDSAISKIKKSEWEEFGEVIHVIAALMYFNKKGILAIDIEDLKNNALVNISNIYKNKDHLYVKEFKLDPFNTSWGGYSYQGQNDTEFKDFMESLSTHIDRLDDDWVRGDAVNLLNLMAEDPRLFYQRICLTNAQDNYYWNIPILKEIPPKDFSEMYTNLDLKSFKVVYSALSNRYNASNIDLLQPEKNWLASVIENVEIIIESKTGVERLKLEDYSLKQLKKIYKEKFS